MQSQQASGTISGFRPQGRNIDQTNVAAQQRSHVFGGGTAAFTGSTRTLNGMNEGHQPRDRQVRTRIAAPAAQTPAATVAPPIVAPSVPTAAVPAAPTRSGQDVYREIIQTMADTNPPQSRERSPRTVGRVAEKPAYSAKAAPIAAAKPKKPTIADAPLRPAAIAKSRSKKQQPVSVAASSSSQPPPPPPGAGAVKAKAEQFNIAKKPRPAVATRPLVPQAQISGAKRKAEDDGGVRGRPRQPPAPSTARGTKRAGAPTTRPGRPPQPIPSFDDMQMPKAKKVDTPPRRANQKKGAKVKWTQPHVNTKWSRVAAR